MAQSLGYIVVSGYDETKQIQISGIYYFKSIGKLITVYYSGGAFEFYSTLPKLEAQLADRGFIRAGRSCLVSMNAIRQIGDKKILLSNGTEIRIGRCEARSIKAAADDWRRAT
ncbi:MAG: LytTR family transcriptional regulator DNA-binding domain-containing protein [Oscillospiraceae bacterium]|jgi:DNA-binding LytR/AlgR family response regulator|nr:LytTR family transcriptional regulator DNA-binding domain-containing protein [Oscillospiraceae bacterium]